MARAEIVRDYTGNLTLRVGGVPVDSASVTGIVPGTASLTMAVHIAIPVQHVIFSEQDNVLPFTRPANDHHYHDRQGDGPVG